MGPAKTFGLLVYAKHMRAIEVVPYANDMLGGKPVVESGVEVGKA